MTFLLIVIFVHAFLLTKLMFFPYPEMFLYPYLTNIGLIPYKEIFDQHFPGLLFLPVNFNNLGMTTPEAARVWLIIIVMITHILLFITAKKILADSKNAVIANVVYLIWQPFLEGWTLWIDSFLAIFLIGALFFLLDFVKSKKHFDLIIVGILLSVAVVFKQVVLPLGFLVFGLIFITTRSAKVSLYFLIGFIPPLVAMVLYFWWIGALRDFWFWTIIFNATTYVQSGVKGFDYHKILKIAGVFSPVVFLPIIRMSRVVKLWLLVFFIGSLGGVLDRPDFIHFQPNLPITCLIISLVVFDIRRLFWGKMFLVGYALLIVWWSVIFYKGHIGEKVLFFDDTTVKTAQLIRSYTNPGEQIYLFGPIPHLYQMSNTVPVARIFAFQFPWFLKHTEGMFVAGLKNEQPNLIVRDKTVTIEQQQLNKFAAKINTYIDDNYEVFTTVDSNEFMRKKEKR